MRAEGSQFTKTLTEKCIIGLSVSKKQVLVSHVIDNNTVQIENPENIQISGGVEPYTITPKIDQKETFGMTWKLLEQGKVVGIFPEVGMA